MIKGIIVAIIALIVIGSFAFVQLKDNFDKLTGKEVIDFGKEEYQEKYGERYMVPPSNSNGWKECNDLIDDGGKNYEEFGAIEVKYDKPKRFLFIFPYLGEETDEYEDFCLDDVSLVEFYCFDDADKGIAPYNIVYDCQYGCKEDDGACYTQEEKESKWWKTIG